MSFYELITSEVFISAVAFLLGRFLTPFFPAWVPWLGKVSRGIKEVLEVINAVELENEKFKQTATAKGLKEGEKLLSVLPPQGANK